MLFQGKANPSGSGCSLLLHFGFYRSVFGCQPNLIIHSTPKVYVFCFSYSSFEEYISGSGMVEQTVASDSHCILHSVSEAPEWETGVAGSIDHRFQLVVSPCEILPRLFTSQQECCE